MTVNVYNLSKTTGSVPSGWTEFTAGADRLILLSGTALSTSGSDTHNNHTASISLSTTSGDGTTSAIPTGVETTRSHSHTVSTVTQGAGNHLPPYKNFRCFYRNVSGWDGSIPAESIVMNETVPAGWTAHDSGSSYFIRIASTYGGTGGALKHSHTLNGTCDQIGPTFNTKMGGAASGTPWGHTHTFSGSSADSSDSDYYYSSIGLVTNSIKKYVKKDMHFLFDGDPGTKWSAITATNRLLRLSSTGSYATGGSHLAWSHSHTVSFTSDQCSSAAIYSSGGNGDTMPPHTHTVSGSLASLSVTPSYIVLHLYKALTDIIASFGSQVVSSFNVHYI
jgi:hypothetical protein